MFNCGVLGVVFNDTTVLRVCVPELLTIKEI